MNAFPALLIRSARRKSVQRVKTPHLAALQYARAESFPQDDPKHHKHAVYASETTGLLLIAFLLLVLTLIRYWHEIHWSFR